MKKSVGFLFIGLLLIMAILVGFVLFLDPQSSSNGALSSRGASLGDVGEEDLINTKETNAKETATKETDSTGTSGGGSGSTGSPMGTPVEDSDGRVCYERQISYSTSSLDYSSECIAQSGDLCINKVMNCSIILKNLDKNITGEFKIEFRAIELDNREEVLSSNQISQNVSAKSEEPFKTTLQVLGEEASQNISCEYSSILVPKEIICS